METRRLLGEMSRGKINTDDWFGNTPLYWACRTNNAPAAAALLQTPVIEVNIKKTDGDTPIMWCNIVG